MAKLSDLKLAQQEQDSAIAREEAISQIAVAETPTSEQKFVIFKLVDTKKRGRVYMHHMDDVVNPATGKVERMRLLTGVDSLWLKDQKEVTEEYARANRPITLVFENRHLRIPKWDENTIKFLRTTRHCVDNPKRVPGSKLEYFEWNPAKQEEEALKKEMLEIEVMQLAMDQPFEKIKKHAQFLGVSFVDEMGEPKTESGIRTNYIMKAKRDPERFKESMGSKEVEVSWMIKRAVIDNKIDLGKQAGSAHFAAGGFICKIPAARKAVEYLIELALTNSEEGKTFLQQLQQHST